MTLTYKQKFNIKHKQPKDKSNSLADISRLSGYKKSGLQTVFNKGVGAFKTNPKSVRPNVKSADQWAYARVYAAINPSSKAHKIDKTHLKKK
tara:strand:- start:190 stop:465 length:276 start_codon:yes stop_codon:yes gene_type:complete